MDKRLVEIQKRREDTARTEFQEKREAAEIATEKHEEAHEEWSRYANWRETEAERMFNQIENQHVSIKDMQDYHKKLLDFKQQEVELNRIRNKKLIAKNLADTERDDAKEILREKQVKHEKFKVINEKLKEEQKRLRIKQEEAEEEETNELFIQSKTRK